jgi:hypothetical protein
MYCIFRFFLADLCVGKRRSLPTLKSLHFLFIFLVVTGPREAQLLGSSYLNHLDSRCDWLFPYPCPHLDSNLGLGPDHTRSHQIKYICSHSPTCFFRHTPCTQNVRCSITIYLAVNCLSVARHDPENASL